MEIESALEFAADHPAFAGHFPGAPIVPGVLLLDAALHACEAAGVAVTGVASAKFLQPVAPGQSLSMRCRTGAAGRVSVSIARGDVVVTTGQLLSPP
jgi:3-hydroxymyristoyl/3-hydroxydecanoyl-(acyl carrier protein) dehydratase